MNECFQDLARIAATMEALEKKTDATLFHDMLSGALIWSDEFPKNSPVSTGCLRFVLSHRTALITGEQELRNDDFWREALRQFPKWIGFSPERTAPNEALVQFYTQQKKLMLDNLERDTKW
jgi:hypothetical protein